MKRLLIALLMTGFVVAQDQKDTLTVGLKVGQKIPKFSSSVLNLKKKKAAESTWNSHKTANPTAYIFMSQSCPVVRQYISRLQGITKSFAKKKVDFVFVYPTRKASLDSKKTYHKKQKFGGLLCDDRKLTLAKTLGIKKTPEIVFASKKGEILFRGCIDDNPNRPKKVKSTYLKNAINEHLAGKAVKVKTSRLYG